MTGMDELGPEARALLDAAREGLSPDPAAIRRVHGRIHAAATGAAVGTALGVKLGIAGLVAALAIGGGVYLRRGVTPAPASMPSIELAGPAERPERAAVHEAAPPSDEDLITIEAPSDPVRRGDARRPAAPPAIADPPPGAIAAPAASSSRAAVAASGPRATAGAASPHAVRAVAPATGASKPTGIDLGREVALIDIAMAALRRNDAAGALRVMQEYAAEAGDAGQLGQDAAAIEIEALCKLGDPAARAKRAAFDARFPHSVQRARLEAACR